jgi:hypothetical protein
VVNGVIPDTAAEALAAAGRAVNDFVVDDESAIRMALPIASAAASRVTARIEGTGQYGRYTGLRIAKAQNWLYERNRHWQFSNATLCVLWCVEFPDAKSDYAARSHYIASTRRDYNAGRHQTPAPSVPSVSYDRDAAASRPRRSPGPKHTNRGIALPPVATTGQGEIPSRNTVRLSFTSDLKATFARRRALEAYLKSNVLGLNGFVCRHFAECKGSHDGDYFEGQLHHIGRHYDLKANGKDLRIVVVGQEVGNGPARVPMQARTHAVRVETGKDRRFFAEGRLPGRNPHMRGTTSLLRLATGSSPGRDYEGEWITVGNERVHLYDAFSLLNFLLCSAIAAGQGEKGSKRGASTRTMQQRCAEHFAAAVRILQPTAVVNQGKGVRKWMSPLIEVSRSITPTLESVRISGHEFFLASFTHPSVPSADNWGTDEHRPYLASVVAPTVRRIHRELGIA